MTIRYLLTAGVLVIALSACAHAAPAQVVLADLADSAHSERIATDTAMMGVGVTIGVASGLFLMDTELGIYGLIVGASSRPQALCFSCRHLRRNRSSRDPAPRRLSPRRPWNDWPTKGDAAASCRGSPILPLASLRSCTRST